MVSNLVGSVATRNSYEGLATMKCGSLQYNVERNGAHLLCSEVVILVGWV